MQLFVRLNLKNILKYIFISKRFFLRLSYEKSKLDLGLNVKKPKLTSVKLPMFSSSGVCCDPRGQTHSSTNEFTRKGDFRLHNHLENR